MRGDLDAVLLKALSRNVIERYPSVEAFRADLLRWLEGRPVIAKPPSIFATLRKFVARNAIGVTLGSAAASAVIAAAIIAILQAHEARTESRRAAATRDFLIGLFENANPELHGGRDLSLRDMLIDAEFMIDESVAFDSEIKSELYATIASLSVKGGDFEMARRTTEKRVDALSIFGATSLTVDSLIDLAEVAVQRNSKSDLALSIDKLEQAFLTISPNRNQESRYRWYLGWRALKSEDYESALLQFSSSSEISCELNDMEGCIRAVYGKLITNVARDERGLALQNFNEASQLLKEKTIAPVDRLRRELELVSAIYNLGEYSLGWPIINRLVAEDEKINTHSGLSRHSPRYLWALWGIRMNESDDVLKWLTDEGHGTRGSVSERDKVFYARLSLIQVEALIETRELANASRVLSALAVNSPELPGEEQLLSTVLRLEIVLATEDAQGFINALANPIWEKLGGDRRRGDWFTYKNWYEGIGHFSQGKFKEAGGSFELAYASSVLEFGENHPGTLMIKFNQTVVRLIEAPKSELNLQRHRTLESIVMELSERIPKDGRLISGARRTLSCLQVSSGNELKLCVHLRRRQMMLH